MRNNGIPYDPDSDNHEVILNWEITPEDAARVFVVARRIAEFIKSVDAKRSSHIGVNAIAMDLTCLHLNGAPQDFRLWELASVQDATIEYMRIYHYLDRTCGKLPGHVMLRWSRK